MEFVLNKNEIFPEIKIGQGVIERKSTLPILSNILISAQSSEIELTSTDLEMGVKSSCGGNIKEEGSLTVPSKKLYDILRSLPDDVDIKFKKEENTLALECGRSNFQLVGLPKDDFPSLPEASFEESIEIDREYLKYAIDMLIFAVGRETSRYAVNGALFVFGQEDMMMVATDGYRLGYINIEDCIGESQEETRLIVPYKTLIEVRKMLDRSDSDTINFSRKEGHCFYRIDGRTLISRVLDESFPNYEKVIPESCEKIIRFSNENLHNAVNRVSLLSDEDSRAVDMKFDHNELEICSRNPDLGEASEVLSIDYKYDPFEVSFNSDYLLDFMSAVDKEDITFAHDEESGVGLMKPVLDDEKPVDYKYVVMPIKE